MTDPQESGDRLRVPADLRVASDQMLRRLDRLHELESTKRQIPPSDPEFGRIAREVEDLARALVGTTSLQAQLADQAADAAKRGDVEVAGRPIRDLPPRRDAAGVLADWRHAERRLLAAAPGSAEEDTARGDVERLRAEYSRIVNRS